MKKYLIIIFLLLSLITKAQTVDSVYNYLLEIGVKHPGIVLAQSIEETGWYKSYSCRVRKNLFGLTRNHKLEYFSTWQESCDKYVKWVEYKYKEGDYYDFLHELGYATNPDYIKNVDKIRKQLKLNKDV